MRCKINIITVVALLLSTNSQAATVVQKSYDYRYETAKDAGSDQEYVICDETSPRPKLVVELQPPPLAIRFGGEENTLPEKPIQVQANPTYQLEKSILFSFDSSKVRDIQGVNLLASSLKTDPTVTGIRIKGYTCDIGTKPYNDKLAMRRALAIGNLLGKAGLQVDEVAGEGKCCYASGERRLSRRVEISVVRTPKKEGQHDSLQPESQKTGLDLWPNRIEQ